MPSLSAGGSIPDPAATITATQLNPANGTTAATISGLSSSATSMAVDMLGNVFIGSFSGTPPVVQFAPPSFGAPAQLAYPSNPVSMAFYPGAIIGNEAGVGIVSSPLPSPVPLPTF